MSEREYQQGDIIFREGDDSREAFWISSGRVDISVDTEDGPKSVAQLGPGQLFGEMGLIDDLPRSATATALEPTTVEMIDEDSFENAVLGDRTRLHGYLAALFERLRTTDTLLQAEINKRLPGAAGRSVESALAESARARQRKSRVAPVKLESRFSDSTMPRVEATIDRFPFRIGRRVAGGMSSFALNDLEIDDPKPYNVSRNHFSIECQDGEVFIRDRGSAHGTIVNGKPLNVQSDTIIAELEEGENLVILGNARSPQQFRITVSLAR